MATRFKTIPTLFFATACVVPQLLPMQPVASQDIEIMDRDGKQANITPEVEGVAPAAQPPADLRALQGRVMGQGDLGLQREPLSVIGPDGQPMLVSTEGARSVMINRSITTVNNNGAREVKVISKAIVIDADGQRHEYVLADTDNAEGLAEMDDSQKPPTAKSYMVGLVCQPTPEMVRSQLGLESEDSLLVKVIAPGSPAETAGLKKYDVLLFADDQQLASLKDLTAVVQEAGADDRSIMLTVVRGGDEIPVEIKPAERDLAAAPARGMPMDMFEMNDIDPGNLFGDGNDAGMNRMREMMREQMKQMKEELQNLDGIIPQGLPMQMPPEKREFR